MAMEVSCGQCNGRLLVETPGIVVACPHCGVHLLAPEADSPVVPPLDASTADSENPTAASPGEDRSAAETIVVKGVSKPSEATAQLPTPTLAESPAPESDQQMPFFAALQEPTRADSSSKTGDVDNSLAESLSTAKPTSPETVISSTIVETPSPAIEVPQTDNSKTPEPAAAPQIVPEESGQTEADSASQIMEATVDAKPRDIPDSKTWKSIPDQSPAAPVLSSGSMEQPDFSWLTAAAKAPEVASEPGLHLNANPEVFNGAAVAVQPPSTSPTFASFPAFSPSARTAVSSDDGASPSGGATMKPFSNRESTVSTPSFSTDVDGVRHGRLVLLLIIVGSYASLVTIYAICMSLFGRAHQLESLPDLKTVQQQGGRAAVPRPDNDLPPAHDLRLGQSRRFGNILATPLRVTRGPIQFEHYTGKASQERMATEPVLKLWLKFENVSAEQAITPMDSTLMFFRRVVDDQTASYNVIFDPQDRQPRTGKFYYPFDRMAEDSEWRIVGQHANEAIAPHSILETFIPSEENIEGLTGDIVWRVHFRKGYGPKTGNGVTTLIDVRFHRDEIVPDAA